MVRVRSARREESIFPARGLFAIRKDKVARFLPSERHLRRAIPWLTALFILVTAGATVLHQNAARQATLDGAARGLSLLADVVAGRLQARGVAEGDLQTLLAGALPEGATAEGRLVLVADVEERIRAGAPLTQTRVGEPLSRQLGSEHLLLTFGDQAGVMEVVLPDGRPGLATLRNLDGPGLRVAVVQPIADALAAWRRGVGFVATMLSTAGLLVILLAGAYLHAAPARPRQAPAPSGGALEPVLAAAGGGHWDWDLARGLIRWSPAMYRRLGRDAQDDPLSFREIADLCHPDDDLYGAARRAMRAGDGPFDRTVRLRHADGTWLSLRLTGIVTRDAGSGESRLNLLAWPAAEAPADVARDELTDPRLGDAIESISEAFVLWDRDNRLVLCNSKYRQFHGLPDDAVRPGMAYEQVMAAGREPAIQAEVPAAGEAGAQSRTYEARIEDGRWLHVNERRTRDGGYVSVGTDVTDLKKSEQRLFESEKELKATVVDLRLSRRALEQQKQQLVDLAEKYALEKNRAEAASRSKSEFLANISHELRTPLNAVIGFSEVMQDALFGPLGNAKYEEYARDIHASGKYLLDVIDDILDMSRIEAGRIDLNVEPIEVGDIVEDSLRVVAPSAEARGIALKRSGASQLDIQADRRAVKQILLNLLSNAVKFTPDGGRVTLRLSAGNGGYARIAIADTGVGIPDSQLRNLGRPFEQVENQLAKSRKGSGLGLAISRSLVEMHGGRLEIESREGKGTTVTCILPIRAERDDNPDLACAVGQ